MAPFAIASAVIVAVAAVLAWRHWSVWQAIQKSTQSIADEREQMFAFRQFRRRMQISAMLSVVGAMILIGVWIDAPLAALCYWLAVVALVVWIMLLAGADMLATRMHFSVLETEHNVKTFKLKTALDDEIRKQAATKRREPDRGGRDEPKR